MAAKKTAKKADTAKKGKKPERKRVEVKDLDAKKDTKGGAMMAYAYLKGQ